MNTTYLALLSATPQVPYPVIREVAQVLQRQFNEHFSYYWKVGAVITPLEHLSQLDRGVAPIIICNRDSVGDDATFGLHMVDNFGTPSTEDDTPFALVEYQPNGAWSRDASHECMELVVDPYGHQLLSAPDPVGQGWTVDYLVEICDPCGREYGTYHFNDSPWPLSDFVVPTYYTDPTYSTGHYSLSRQLTQPRTLRPGGYVTWCHYPTPSTPRGMGDWYMTSFSVGSAPMTVKMTPPVIDQNKHIRQWVDLASRDFLARHSRSKPAREMERRLLAERRLIKTHRDEQRKAQHALWKKTLATVLSGPKAGKKKAAGKKPPKKA